MTPRLGNTPVQVRLDLTVTSEERCCVKMLSVLSWSQFGTQESNIQRVLHQAVENIHQQVIIDANSLELIKFIRFYEGLSYTAISCSSDKS